MIKEDTIAAIATAPGEGGIGIVRISGDKALDILKKIFVPASSKIENRHLSYGHVRRGRSAVPRKHDLPEKYTRSRY